MFAYKHTESTDYIKASFYQTEYKRNVARTSLLALASFGKFFFFWLLFTDTFLKLRFRWKVEIISTFPIRTNVAFILNE